MATTVNDVVSADNTQFTAPRKTGGLGKDDFLRLLTTQLANQDPMNPANEQEMAGQLAQFTALEQTGKLADSMAALTKTNQWSQAGSLLNRTVVGKTEKGETAQGIVKGLSIVGENLMMHLDSNQDVPLTNLGGVIA